jgi:hypothetical protein
MSQPLRRRIAARERLDPRPRSEDELPPRLRIRRFSEGLERAVLDGIGTPRVGRFSSGHESLPESPPPATRIGSFSRGHDHERDDDPAYLRVGTFADSEDPRAAG